MCVIMCKHRPSVSHLGTPLQSLGAGIISGSRQVSNPCSTVELHADMQQCQDTTRTVGYIKIQPHPVRPGPRADATKQVTLQHNLEEEELEDIVAERIPARKLQPSCKKIATNNFLQLLLFLMRRQGDSSCATCQMCWPCT